MCIDSGLSLTTVRNATEHDTDRDSTYNKQQILRNSKHHRSMPIKRNNHDTDSDDVFDEVISFFVQFKINNNFSKFE